MNKQVLESLIEFIKIDSYAFKKREVMKAQKFVKEYLSGIEIDWVEYPSTDSELASILVGKSKRWDKDKPEITLTGHIDIVYPDIKDFKIEVSGGKLFGPGTADMKAGVMVILETVKSLDKTGNFENISLLFTSEEEHFRTSAYPDFPEIAKGINNLLVYEGEGSIDELPDLKEKLLVTKRKGILAYNLKATGPGGHSGVLSKKEERHSAIHELISQADQIRNLANYEEGTTINIGIFKGGQALNMLAPEAEIVFDARLETVSEYDRIKKAVESITPFDSKMKFDLNLLVSGFPVEETSQNKNLYSLAKDVGKEIGMNIGFVHKGGASDMNRLTAFNTKMAALDYLGPGGGGEHTKDEFLFLDTFDPSLKLSIALISKLQKSR